MSKRVRARVGRWGSLDILVGSWYLEFVIYFSSVISVWEFQSVFLATYFERFPLCFTDHGQVVTFAKEYGIAVGEGGRIGYHPI